MKNLLDDWSHQYVYTDEELDKFGKELPLSLEQYEKVIVAEEKGYQLEMKRV